MHVMYRVNRAEYVMHMLVVAPQEYVNLYSTRRHTSTHAQGTDPRTALGSI